MVLPYFLPNVCLPRIADPAIRILFMPWGRHTPTNISYILEWGGVTKNILRKHVITGYLHDSFFCSYFLFLAATFLHVGAIGLTRNNVVTNIPKLGKTFQISLDVWLEPLGNDVWQSVFHFSTGIDNSRLPAVFIGNNKKCIMVFQSIVFNCKNLLKSHRWVNWEFSQHLVNGKVRWKWCFKILTYKHTFSIFMKSKSTRSQFLKNTTHLWRITQMLKCTPEILGIPLRMEK